MVDWQQTASFVLAFGGMGAFIDFFLGKRGQSRVKTALESFWIGLAYVNFRTFARAEAAMAHDIFLRMFGSFFSRRRAISVGLLLMTSSLIWLAYALINFDNYFNRSDFERQADWLFEGDYYGLSGQLILALPLLLVSISVTIWLTKIASLTITSKIWINVVCFFVLIFLQLSLFPLTYVTTYALGVAVNENLGPDAPSAAVKWFISALPGLVSHVFSARIFGIVEYPFIATGRIPWLDYRVFMLNVMYYLPGVLRLLLAAAFVLSIFARPIHTTVLLLIQRLVESDKPIFTVVFSGSAAIVKFIQSVFL